MAILNIVFNYMENAILSKWTGSVNTAELVRKQFLSVTAKMKRTITTLNVSCVSFLLCLRVNEIT